MHKDLSFLIGIILGVILSRSGVAGVLAGIVIGLVLASSSVQSWEDLKIYIQTIKNNSDDAMSPTDSNSDDL